MDKKTFDEGRKLFKRFLKDKGLYQAVYVNFMFRGGLRTEENLFKEFNSNQWLGVDDWRQVLTCINLMSGYIWKFDDVTYNSLIKNNNLSEEWRKYYTMKALNGLKM